MKNFFFNIKNVQILGPKNRVGTYLAYCGHVFNFKNIMFIEKANDIIENDYILFIDQIKLSENLNILKKKKIKLIIILLWNSDRDYYVYKNEINFLKKNFKLKVISFSNFSKEIYFPLNKFKINKTNTLIKIKGVKFISKIKYLFPTIYSIYNSILYWKISKNFLFSEKLIFVGIGNKNDAVNQLNLIIKNNYSQLINKICVKLIEIIRKNDLHKCLKKMKLLLLSNNFQKIQTSLKYYIGQVVFRYLLLEKLNNYKNFYHKNNSSFPFDPLKSNLYFKTFHLELGSQSGNTDTHTRKIYLEKFYSKRYLEINFFDSKNNYKNKNIFYNVLEKYFNFIENIYSSQNYDISTKNLIFFLKKNYQKCRLN